MVPVYEWIDGGNVVGCGTQAEFDYWTAEGVVTAGTVLGKVISHEPVKS